MIAQLFVRAAAAGLVAVLAVACSPALDWRDVRPDDGALTALFPCKPRSLARAVPLAGETTRMTLVSCTAQEAAFGLAFVDAGQPAQVPVLMAALRDAALANIDGRVVASAPGEVRGMTPQAQSQRLTIAGKRADGAAVDERTLLFAQGLRVYQASIVGQKLDAEAADTFLGSMRFLP